MSIFFVIFNLFKLYKQVQENNIGSFEDVHKIKDQSADSSERLKAEKSKIYVGYKILWAIRLLLNGRNFPSGNIPEKRWYSYVH